jgi:Amidohydrolase
VIGEHQLTWTVGAPVEDAISIMHLITHGIPSRFPNIKIINSHLGGALPMLLQRADNQYPWEAPNTRERPSAAASRMWYDTVGHGHPPDLPRAVTHSAQTGLCWAPTSHTRRTTSTSVLSTTSPIPGSTKTRHEQYSSATRRPCSTSPHDPLDEEQRGALPHSSHDEHLIDIAQAPCNARIARLGSLQRLERAVPLLLLAGAVGDPRPRLGRCSSPVGVSSES